MSTTTSTSPTPTPPPPLPSGWTVKSACAQDGASRILSNDVGTTLSNNTPNNCIAYCTAKGYDFAGVEYGSECHCGTGTANDPSPLDPSSCGNPCAGDAGQTCGGSWAIQIYQNPAVPETLPDGWALVRYCAVDEANRVIIDDQVTILPNNTPATCVEYCDAAEFDYAGVEYGDECHCGTGYTGGARAPTTDCNMPCSGNPSLTCGAGWRIQIYSSEPQTSS
ncbi:WSC-domain-containing protein [Phanerochaete sordida]|uniref:WSC-domain-containing protein n=1 Tax=Phanerochaete sordida TaxID=48140 RepID=A0A9P3G5E2_9APHY|nr:WSC-domain-containing protein [Phanerochaete sordida]